MAASGHEGRYISNSHFGDNTNIYQGDRIFNLHVLHNQARAEVKAVHAIPYPRNEDLVPRPDLLNRLEELLPQKPGFYSAALWGLGGSGKTQLALHYAYQRCNDSELCVFWVHADSEATFTTDYKKIGKKLGVSDTLDGSDLLDAVRISIEAQPQWLIIFDNADDLKLFGVVDTNRTDKSLYKYIPQGSHGTVLWTSRNRKIQGTLVGSTRGIEVPAMTRNEATSLLVTASGDTSAVEDTEIGRLLEELERLPLAVSQAGAYIRQTSTTIKEYLELLMQRSKRWDLLNMNGFDRHRRPEVSNSVLETWKISTSRIREESELSYRILHVIAYLDNQDIPYELLMSATQYDVDDKGKAKEIPEAEVKLAVTRLVEFSFLNMRREEGGFQSYEMHKLVQEAVRYGLWAQGRMEVAQEMITTAGNSAENGEANYSSMALQIVDGIFPLPEKTSWAKCDKYMAHAIRVGEWAEVSGKKIESAMLLNKVSAFLYGQGRWREKEPVDRRAVDLFRDTLGERHPDTLSSMSDLAGGCFGQGRYDEAEKIYTNALNLRREVLGEKHQDTIRSMQLLAITYMDQARYVEAEGLLNQALNFQYEVVGERHPNTMWTMSYLASVYSSLGQNDKAQEIQEQTLSLQQEVLGKTHPDTIISMGVLAEIYYLQGQYDKAEVLQNQVLAFRQEELGEKHPNTLREMATLAMMYFTQRRLTDAGRIQKEVVNLYQELFGEKHPVTIRCKADLATTFREQGQFDEAEEILERVLGLQREILGEKHPMTIRHKADLALTVREQGQFDKAQEMLEQALSLQQEVLGENHPVALKYKADLAITLREQGQLDKAEEILEQVLSFQREVIGEKHPMTNATRRNLGIIYHKQGRYHEAEGIFKQALTFHQEALGENHPRVLLTLGSLAETHVSQGKLDQAEQVQRQLLRFQRETLGNKHPETIDSIKYLKLIKLKQVLSLRYLFRRLKE